MEKDKNKVLVVLADGGSTDGYMDSKKDKKSLDDFKKNGKVYTVSFALE